jgi:hypothetical protein
MSRPDARAEAAQLEAALAWALLDDGALTPLIDALPWRWTWNPATRSLFCGPVSARLLPPAPPFAGRGLELTIARCDAEPVVLRRCVPGFLFDPQPDIGPGDGPAAA